MSARLDIFSTLNALDRRDFGFLSEQPEALRKTFVASVGMRWMSALSRGGIDQDLTLLTLNEVANVNLFDITDHPELQFKLIASCGLGRKLDHQWIPVPKSGRASSELADFLRQHWPEANELEIDVLLSQFTRESFSTFVLDAGCEKARHKDLLKLYDRHRVAQDEKTARQEART